MDTIKIKSSAKKVPANIADIITPVSIYLKIRDLYPNTILLESSDYHGNNNSQSFICFQPLSEFKVNKGNVEITYPGGELIKGEKPSEKDIPSQLDRFINLFDVVESDPLVNVNGLFGYSSYDAVQHFESIKFNNKVDEEYEIPEMRYTYYKYILAFNHFTNQLNLIENLPDGDESIIDEILDLLHNRTVPAFNFHPDSEEVSNVTDEEYMEMVKKGKDHCYKGDVFQIVLSRQFKRKYSGDEFNVYRALRNINPSPYLFFFDYGSYKILGSSPESQLVIENGEATINPIAGTFKRTGDDKKDRELAKKLSSDPKENAEHVMLVDLARNDLSRNCDHVKVKTYKEVQYYSHVLHLVSDVRGQLLESSNTCRVMADTFPAGTLSGAPKFMAMELIDKYENQNRGYYGGCIGMLGLDGSFNQAIMIRSFLCKNNTLFYQAGAGVVSESVPESELAEVNNKLGALKKAVELATEF
ncbi:anthranilate synthase component I family protein [Plebeiibacterium sediminum]|uniref:Anthranilate synthase component 1 n=1 Tax=Plebeiibacterium sediminum TaxID=2992112 RepID=A0AAE3SEC9_9BACT|nr:anthranilate synthase component I family protein [Plebeiobacterium sediminum]MCW3786091.1 anthranilate synthase component I family protein [Plebeiobacterium sediminum]